MRGNVRLLFVAAIALGFVAASRASILSSHDPPMPEQTVGKRLPVRPISSIKGEDLYRAYCEQCHGRDGKGDGPAAPDLKKPPGDLTQLAARNNGKFDRPAVERFIMGDRPGGVLRSDKKTNQALIVYADGTADEMPVYKILFRALWREEPAIIRCSNIARYLESIQAKN